MKLLRLFLANTGAALLVLLLVSGCGDSVTGHADEEPVILSNAPLNGATNVPLNGTITANFSEEMDSSTFNASTFTLTHGDPPVSVPGTVIYANGKAVFWPSVQLTSGTTYTATITTGVKNVAGVNLAKDRVWTFVTGNTVIPGLPVSLGAAGTYVILAKTAISSVPASAVTGYVGISPAAASNITGFSLIMDPMNVFSTSSQVTGRVYAADYTPPAPYALTTAVGDMELAFTAAAGRAPDLTELAAGNIGGKNLAPGVYKWGTGLLIPTNVTLNGSATDVWIFQIAQDLTVSDGARIILAGGALAKNIFWQVAGSVDIGTTAHIEGIVLCQTAINLRTGASINGRLLAQTAVTIDGSTVVEPAQ